MVEAGQAPQKIHIVGGPGSGKTTLARRLSSWTGIPFHELDLVRYEGGSGPPYPLEVRLKEIERLANQPAWITEGIYLGWTEVLFQRAELIIWLDLPWRVVAPRIVRRHLLAELRRNNRHPGWRKLINFMKWVRQYQQSTEVIEVIPAQGDIAENRVSVALYMQGYSSKVIHCITPVEVKACSKRLMTARNTAT